MLHTQEVAGSKPAAPTKKPRRSERFEGFESVSSPAALLTPCPNESASGQGEKGSGQRWHFDRHVERGPIAGQRGVVVGFVPGGHLDKPIQSRPFGLSVAAD